jgi:hypothetical protein
MNKLRMCVFAAGFSLVSVGTLFAANYAWSGTWKEEIAQTKLGHRFVITEKPGGIMHATNGTTSHEFACDGKLYPLPGGRTVTCTGNPKAGYDLTFAQNGHTVEKQHRTFSADGKEMMIEGTAYRADSSTMRYESVRRREGNGTGMAGTWVLTKMEKQPDVQIWSLSGDTMQIQSPVDNLSVSVKLDGSDTKMVGPNTPQGATLSLDSEGVDKLAFEHKVNGRVINEGTYTLSADGKVMTEEVWGPGGETQKRTVVYKKQ